MDWRHFLYLAIAISLSLGACTSSPHEENEEEEEHNHGAGTELPAETAEKFGVETEIVAPSSFHDVIKTSGVIEPSNSDSYIVSSRKRGVVTLAPDVALGADISSGQRIATVSSTGVEGGDAGEASMANLKAAKAEYERLLPLYEKKLVTASVFREAERAYEEARALAGNGGSAHNSAAPSVLTSSISGSLVELYVKSGEFVEVGEPLALVVKNTRQILKADLPVRLARHLPHLQSANFIVEGGDSVMQLSLLDGKKVSGNLSAGVNGYIPVAFSFAGNSLTTAGGFAEVFLICGQRDDVISVPREALVEIQGNKYAYVVDEDDDDCYEKRLVVTGASDGQRVEILKGLEPGEKVVTKGASVIRMAEISAIAPPAHTHNH